MTNSGLIIENVAFSLGKVAVADGTSEVLTAVEDLSGYDSVCWVVAHGDVDAAAVMTYTVKENTASSTSSPTPTAITLTEAAQTGASISSGALTITESSGNLDNKLVVVGAGKNAFSKRYAFLSITCTVESHEILAIYCIKSGAKSVPVTQGSDVAAVGYAG